MQTFQRTYNHEAHATLAIIMVAALYPGAAALRIGDGLVVLVTCDADRSVSLAYMLAQIANTDRAAAASMVAQVRNYQAMLAVI
jgi:hypothetical protein